MHKSWNNNVSRIVPYKSKLGILLKKRKNNQDFPNPIKPDWSNIHWQYPNQSFFRPKCENISPLCLNLFIFPACRSAGKVEPSVELQVDLSLDTPSWENVKSHNNRLDILFLNFTSSSSLRLSVDLLPSQPLTCSLVNFILCSYHQSRGPLDQTALNLFSHSYSQT